MEGDGLGSVSKVDISVSARAVGLLIADLTHLKNTYAKSFRPAELSTATVSQ